MSDKYVVKHDPIYDRVEISPGPFVESERHIATGAAGVLLVLFVPLILLLLAVTSGSGERSRRKREQLRSLPTQYQAIFYIFFFMFGTLGTIGALFMWLGGDSTSHFWEGLTGVSALLWFALNLGGIPAMERMAENRETSTHTPSKTGIGKFPCPECGRRNYLDALACNSCGVSFYVN